MYTSDSRSSSTEFISLILEEPLDDPFILALIMGGTGSELWLSDDDISMQLFKLFFSVVLEISVSHSSSEDELSPEVEELELSSSPEPESSSSASSICWSVWHALLYET